MCGIAAIVQLSSASAPVRDRQLSVMGELLAHRGPDGQGQWTHPQQRIGLAHRRLSIIDLVSGAQPMSDGAGNWITFNGEIYNYRELRRELGEEHFRSNSDTEVILHAWHRWGTDCVSHLRGMFAFVLWDEATQTVFMARDRFGIKPLYHAEVNGLLYIASEIKALLPFLPEIDTNPQALKDYLAFQFCLLGKTLFKGVCELPAAHSATIRDGRMTTRRYWEVWFQLDHDHTQRYFSERLRHLLDESIDLHLRADVPVGAYVSGGIDSGVIAAVAARRHPQSMMGFVGKYDLGPEYDESPYARDLAATEGFPLHELSITSSDFITYMPKVIWHLDAPVAGPGSFSQYMISMLAAKHRKVVLGGQGGDEIFGGYTRYLIAYFEQCIKSAINGTSRNGNFVVTYESIIPQLTALRNYKPLLQEFWRDGLFGEMDERYFRLINRAPMLGEEIHWGNLGAYSPITDFRTIFHGNNVGKQSYFDLMTHFDFKTLLPALLQVEDRMSMAHGLESRVPLLDHPLVELVATIPADIKFRGGHLKHAFRDAFSSLLPPSILARTDKMGFPTPFSQWAKGPARDFIRDILGSQRARERSWINNRRVLEKIDLEPQFGRNLWGLFCLELWQQTFHDQAARWRKAATP